MSLKKVSIILILIFSFSNTSFPQNDGAGNTGLAFLKLGVGARSIAMGEAFSSISDDATAIIYNPARLNFGLNNNVTLMHNFSVQDMSTDFIGTKFTIDKFAFGVGILKTSVNDIEVRNIPGEPLDKFDSQNLSINLSVSYKLYDVFSIGISSKFLYEKIYVDDASGLGFDFGTSYSKDNLNFSFVVANIGSIDELRNTSTKLPTLVRFGSGYSFFEEDFSFLIGVDGFKVLDGGQLHIHTGGEVGYRDFVFARVGYQSNYENKNITTGLGFKYKSIYLDYAFVPYTSEFGSSNTFSLGMSF
ncbi:MAG: PorV/PorQ family protein [Bacteroidetes bacterium]|nr:PorV/PorQ family protein [Bacteroidota bacterium]